MIRRVVGLSKRRPLLREGLVSTSSRVIANASCAAGSSTGYDFCISPPEMPVATAASCMFLIVVQEMLRKPRWQERIMSAPRSPHIEIDLSSAHCITAAQTPV